MTTYTIVIDDDDRDSVNEGTEWSAALYRNLAPGDAAPILVSGIGASPIGALGELLEEAPGYIGDSPSTAEFLGVEER